MKHRADGLAEALLTPAGAVARHLAATQITASVLPAIALEALYAQGGLAARIVDKPADDAFSRGIDIEGDSDKVIAGELDRLSLWNVGPDALRWKRLYGGGALVLICDDGAALREPLRVQQLQQIVEIRAVDCDSVRVASRYLDPAKPNFGTPEVYEVRTPYGASEAWFRLHESRLIALDCAALPPTQARAEAVPWKGRSALAGTYRSITRLADGLAWSLSILERKQQAVNKMFDLAKTIQDFGIEGQALIQQRATTVDMIRSVLNSVTIDAEDDYKIYDLGLAGIADVLQEFKEQLSAETGIPVTVLFGRAPAGMNSTGEGDLEIYYSMVGQEQGSSLKRPLERLVSLLWQQRSLKGKTPPTWHLVFPPLWMPSAAEQATARQANATADYQEAQALALLIDKGTLTTQQAESHLADVGRYGLAHDTRSQ